MHSILIDDFPKISIKQLYLRLPKDNILKNHRTKNIHTILDKHLLILIRKFVNGI